eukprot:TRINITY_DN10652_c0_g1_i1.p1 TRINITY_DN10652_c0_g1~~TRINITY_DN10652_c0_g1_i1.p1  ORF type:complete len:187 (-),score=29.99 TRINITY_DN10652_c0_g1_i1:65-586(-)
MKILRILATIILVSILITSTLTQKPTSSKGFKMPQRPKTQKNPDDIRQNIRQRIDQLKQKQTPGNRGPKVPQAGQPDPITGLMLEELAKMSPQQRQQVLQRRTEKIKEAHNVKRSERVQQSIGASNNLKERRRMAADEFKDRWLNAADDADVRAAAGKLKNLKVVANDGVVEE